MGKLSNLLPDGLPKILPPYEDGIFQALLTLPEAHVALVSLVSALIERSVKDVTLRNNDAPTRDADAKREKYDINCVVDGENGDQCNVEMQASPMKGDSGKNEHRNVKWRSVYNLCHLHSNQPGSGRKYDQFVKSYQIMLCNYKVFDFENELAEKFTFRNQHGHELCEAVTSIFVDLTKAKEIAGKTVGDMSDTECWVTFFALGNDPQYSAIIGDIAKTKEGVAVAYDTLLNISQNADERARFHSRRMWLQDREHDLAVVRQEGIEEGRVETRAEYEPLLASKDDEIASKDIEIASKDAELASKDSEIASKDNEIASKDSEIEALRAQLRKIGI